MTDRLLAQHTDRLAWKHKVGSIQAREALRTQTGTDLNVVVGDTPAKPPVTDIRSLWHRYEGKRDEPTVVAVAYPSADGATRYAVHGPTDETTPVFGVAPSTVETVLAWALAEHSYRALIRDLTLKLESLKTGDPRPRNEGLFTAHALNLAPGRSEFAAYSARGKNMLPRRGTELLKELGYRIESLTGQQASVLLSDTDSTAPRRALAVLLKDGESIESPLGRLGSTNAVTYGRDIAIREGLPWLVILAGPKIRLYPTNPDVGVGRKGVTQTFVELDLDLLNPDTAGFLPLLFSADSLAADGAVAALLEESARHAIGLADRLRERIYEKIMPDLAENVAWATGVTELDPEDQKDALVEAYHQAMIVLFRLLFIAYAEDRGLLPYGKNAAYTDASMESIATILLNDPDAFTDEESTYLWGKITALWAVIDKGNKGMGVPAYNGGLFTADPEKNPAGADTYDLNLPDSVTSAILAALLIDTDDDEVHGLVDFRDLDVREFGTIYEGLLESGLSIADTDLTVDTNDTYVPVKKKTDDVYVEAGQVYFHSRAGTRKATGSYFTKPFAVHHLLDTALEPALDAHLDKVKALADSGREQSAADLLWDFRIADLSMGSAHFLVAAIDRIEDRFSRFFAANPLPPVTAELAALRTAARERAWGTVSDEDLDDASLMRRVIARRCIYGLDINEIAVELARLAVWIHTFVPGLPLSFLDHNLIWGNSLTGVGTLDEITTAINEAEARELGKKDKGQTSIGLTGPLDDLLARANATLAALSKVAETTPTEVDQARAYQQQLLEDLQPLSALCDLITAERTTRNLGKTDPTKIRLTDLPNLGTAVTGEDLETSILAHPALARAREIAATVQASHMPVLFPEVFNRVNPGYDVILGNPPWKELTIEELQFWSIRFPGLKGVDSEAQQRQIRQHRRERPDLVAEYEERLLEFETARALLTNGPYDGIGEGDPDVYKAFAWRFWSVARNGGHIGVLVPRSMWVTKSGAKWRQVALAASTTIIDLCRNSDNWLFDEVNVGYQITLFSLHKNSGAGRVGLRGEFRSLAQFFAGKERDPSWLDIETIQKSDPEICIPSLTDSESVRLYSLLMKHPGLGDGRLNERRIDFRAAPATEIHATNDGIKKGIFTGDARQHPVFNHLNVGTYIFAPEAGAFNYAPLRKTLTWLQEERVKNAGRATSPFGIRPREWSKDPATLPARNPRLLFRDVIHSSNRRKVWFALAPAETLVTNKAPYLVFDSDDVERDAYLLACLNSGPVDWYGHLRINLNLNFFILYGLPVPTWDTADSRQRRMAELAAFLAVPAGSSGYGDKWADLASKADPATSTDDARAEIDALSTLLFEIPDDLLPLIYDGNPTRPDLASVQAARRTWLASSASKETP